MDFSKIVGAFCLYQVLHKLVASKGKSEFITTKSCENVKTKKCLKFFKPGERGTMMEGAQSEQSDGEQATPMDFLVLTYPVPET